MKTPEQLVSDVEYELEYPLGPNISEVLEMFVEEMDKRYESQQIKIE